MRVIAATILLSISALAQLKAHVVAVGSQDSTVRLRIEIINNGTTEFFVHTCYHQNLEVICSAWPQRLVHGRWMDVQGRGGILGSTNPQQGKTIAAGKSVRFAAEFSTCLWPVSPADTIRLRINPSAYDNTSPLFTKAFRLRHVADCSH